MKVPSTKEEIDRARLIIKEHMEKNFLGRVLDQVTREELASKVRESFIALEKDFGISVDCKDVFVDQDGTIRGEFNVVVYRDEESA